MRSSLYKFLLLIIVGGVLANCAKWKVNPYDLIPQVLTGAAAPPATTSVSVQAQVGELGPNTLQEFGIVYSSTNQQPTTADTKVVASGTSGSAAVMLNNLKPNTTYYYRTYATNNKNLTGYGEVKTFTTSQAIPDAQTLDVISTSATSAQIQVQVANASAVPLKEYGIVYSTTNQQPSVDSDTKVAASGTDGGKVTVTLANLQPNTTYYCRAYGISASGVPGYGTAKTIKTGEPTPVAETLDPVGAPTSASAQVQCQVTNASSISLKEYGVTYSPTSQTPVQGTKVVAQGGKGEKVTLSLSGLQPSTTYYYQAYATSNSGVTGYGVVKTLTTAAVIPSVSTVTLISTKPSQLDESSATVSFKVDPAAAVTEYGMVLTSDVNQVSALMTGTAAPIQQPVTGAFPAAGTVDFQIKSLKDNSPYFAVAYAKDATGKTTFSKDYATFRTKFAARGNWRQLADLPAQRAYVFNPMFTINGKVYVGSQTSGASADMYSDFKQLYEYDPQTNTWATKKDFPGTGRQEPTVVVLNNKAYIMFGYSKTNKAYTPDAWEYDPATDSWRQLTAPPATSSGGSGVFNQQAGGIPFAYNNRVYSLFGRGPSTNVSLTNAYNSQYALDPSGNGSWTVNFPLNEKGLTNDVIYTILRSSTFSFQYNNLIYFGGGVVASEYTAFGSNVPYSTYFNSRQIWSYNPSTQEAKKVALLPSTFNDCSSGNDSNGRMINCAFVVGSKAYIIECGNANTWVLDLTTNATPTIATNLKNPNSTVGIGVTVGSKAYFGLRNNDWWEFTP